MISSRSSTQMAAMNFKNQKFAGGFLHITVSLFLLLVCGKGGLTVNAQGADAGKLYLDRKELDVKEIAANATINNANCDSLNGCSSACSRAVCQPVSGESFLCYTVDNNEYFNSCPSGACQNKIKLDYNRSFVTIPAPGSLNLDTEVARDICLQRPLDSTFETVSLQTEYTLVYLGSTSGAFRAFPGRENNETQCTTFDPRTRPWYLNGISVTKDVKILVDIANTMGSVLPVDYLPLPQNTYLDVAKNITLALLKTFSPQDDVEVLSFNSSDVASLGGPVLIGASYNYLDPAGRPELSSLEASVNNLAASPITTRSDLTKAIVQAMGSFNAANKLKVIVVLSDGLFVPLNSTTFPSAELQSLQAKLMVYKLLTNDDGGDPYLLKTPSLQQNLCSVNGSFERLNALETANPLYAMRSYFTFLARTQLASVGNNATWSNPYSSFDQDRNAITVTYPAFGSDGLLIGVAGIDVVYENLPEPLQDLVFAEFQSRTRGTQPPSNIPLTCSYQSTPASPICANSTPPDSSAICPKTDTSTLVDRTCCGYGTCGAVEGPKHDHLKTGIIVLIVILAAAAFVVVGFFTFLAYRFHQKARNEEKFPPTPPNEPDETVK
ncbi:hypothetical protein KC19_10G036500 [Ceratodon purpureus]|uniref:VWFA domain-containing protein n=1 Tax=Ceratodon purpureus TaxID=3225 RepID=A0A8T0GJ19_CERPU|nr:hypothetical protein KC19_10G036500 [Ceratodon purpureus]